MEVVISLMHNNRILRQTTVRVRADIAEGQPQYENVVTRSVYDDLRDEIDHCVYDARESVLE